MSEATIKADKSKKENVTSLTEEVIDGSDNLVNEPISDYNPEQETNMIYYLHNIANEKA